MIFILKNAHIYAPDDLGIQDVLVAHGKISCVAKNLDIQSSHIGVLDMKGKKLTPGFIDQHIHVSGAGGKDGFLALTPEVKSTELVACGTTTAVGLLGTDGTVKSIRSLYGKVKALNQEGLSAYMFCGYYGVDSATITESIMSDMVFIDPVLGFKIAISDIRSSYPTALELLRKLRDVRTGGLLSQKKGIMHVHLGPAPSKMDILFELVQEHHFPIKHISPTHVGRTKELFDQAIEFAKLGGMIDITTAASKYTEPYKSVLYALDQGVAIDNMTFSTDGHAGLTQWDQNGNAIGLKKASIRENLNEVIHLIKLGGLPPEMALKLVTTGPANNLGLKHKGRIQAGFDADFCLFDDQWKLTDVFAKGNQLMRNGEILLRPVFED